MLVTVIIITTDRSSTIIETLRSVLINRDNYTIVKLFDFNSRDDTVHIVNKFLYDNHLDWFYEINNYRLENCKDWNYALQSVDEGFVTLLEGDDCWSNGIITKIREIIQLYPKVGLVHFDGHNERYSHKKKLKDYYLTSIKYRKQFLFYQLNETYAPSQTFFRVSKFYKPEFDSIRYEYAPEPKMWVDISEFWDIYICHELSVYRGISYNSNLKKRAIIDKCNYALDIIHLNIKMKNIIYFNLSYYYIRFFVLVYIKKVFYGIEKFDFDAFWYSTSYFINTIKKIYHET